MLKEKTSRTTHLTAGGLNDEGQPGLPLALGNVVGNTASGHIPWRDVRFVHMSLCLLCEPLSPLHPDSLLSR